MLGVAQNDLPIAVILPGLDGTTLLLNDFATALGKHFRIRTIAYPPVEALGYQALEDFVRERLPDEDYLLIGESFAGPLALRLAQSRPIHLKCVILGASFARLRLPFKSAIEKLSAAVSPRLIPATFLALLLLGRWSTPKRRRELKSALTRVSAAALTARAQAALTVDLTQDKRGIAVPVLYLEASKDRLIRSAVSDVSIVAEHLTVVKIEAPHFLFQVAPEQCASAIDKFYRERCS